MSASRIQDASGGHCFYFYYLLIWYPLHVHVDDRVHDGHHHGGQPRWHHVGIGCLLYHDHGMLRLDDDVQYSHY